MHEFQDRLRVLRVGDIVSVTGNPGRSASGELSLYAIKHLELLAPCLHPLPDALTNPDKVRLHRHLDLLVHPKAVQTLLLRSTILRLIRSTLFNRGFTEVQTPILAASAGGAIARPFVTTLTSFALPSEPPTGAEATQPPQQQQPQQPQQHIAYAYTTQPNPLYPSVPQHQPQAKAVEESLIEL